MTDNSSGALARFLCSRLCHDLVSPAGAVNAGLELYVEDPESGADALALVRRSAAQLTRRLSFYRFAFGMGGDADNRMTLRGLRAVTADLFKDGNVRLDWPASDDEPESLALLAGKFVLNLILAGMDCLPRGGTLSVRIAALEDGIGVAVQATGLGAKPSDDLAAALDGRLDEDALSARNVLGLLISTLAREVGAEMERDQDKDGEVRIAAMLPPT